MSTYMHTPTGLLFVVDPPDDEGWLVASVPAMPGCITQGRDFPEVARNVDSAIHDYLEIMAQDGMPLPTDTVSVTG